MHLCPPAPYEGLKIAGNASNSEYEPPYKSYPRELLLELVEAYKDVLKETVERYVPPTEEPSYEDLRWRVLGLEEELAVLLREREEMMKESAPLSKFIAIGPMCWGKNDVLEEAVKGCLSYWPSTGYGKKDRKRLFIYLCDEEAYVDGMGSLNYTHRMVIQRGSDRRSTASSTGGKKK